MCSHLGRVRETPGPFNLRWLHNRLIQLSLLKCCNHLFGDARPGLARCQHQTMQALAQPVPDGILVVADRLQERARTGQQYIQPQWMLIDITLPIERSYAECNGGTIADDIDSWQHQGRGR
jgi:hypothetical protein